MPFYVIDSIFMSRTAYCPNGKENDPATSTCIDCQLGYYRNITDGPFDPCQICPENFITVAKGSVSPDQCTLGKFCCGHTLFEVTPITYWSGLRVMVIFYV